MRSIHLFSTTNSLFPGVSVLTLFFIFSSNALASVESDIFVIVSEDARTHIFKQSIENTRATSNYELPEDLPDSHLVFIDSTNNKWDRNGNTLSFQSSKFNLMYRHGFSTQVQTVDDQSYSFQSRNFFAHDGYSKFSYTWILPDSMEVTSYSSNIQSASWLQSENILRFKTSEQNNIQLRINFHRKKPIDQAVTGIDPEVVGQESIVELRQPSTTEDLIEESSQNVEKTAMLKTEDCPEFLDASDVKALLCGEATSVLLAPLNFASNSASLSPKVRKYLDTLVDPLKNFPGMTFEIAAFTDSKGPRAWNMTLSDERAQTIRLYLIFKGVNAAQLVAKGYGENNPIATNATSEGRRTNRRIELKRLN